VPTCAVVDEDEDALLRETCYRALIENKPADQHQVAASARPARSEASRSTRVSRRRYDFTNCSGS
jgi:hypothetical protein